MFTAFQTIVPTGTSPFLRNASVLTCERSTKPSENIRVLPPIPTCELAIHKLGSSDLNVTEVCVGTMVWGSQNTAEEAEAQMDYAFKERGVNFLDCAEIYPVPIGIRSPGGTELIIGDYLQKHDSKFRESLVVATKVCGFSPSSLVPATRERDDIDLNSPPPSVPTRLSRDDIIKACDASLRRLKTDYIDLYQIHWPERYVPFFGARVYDIGKERKDLTPIHETLSAIKELLENGKIRAYGLSNETTYGVAEYVRVADELNMPRPCSIQNQFCMLNRSFEAELAEACAPSHYNISLLPYSILGGGVLSGKFIDKFNADGSVSDPSLKNTRFAMYSMYMTRYKSEQAVDIVKKYARLADEAGMSLASLSQAFCKSRFYIQSSIIGTSSVKQMRENIDSFSLDLDEAILTEIDKIHFTNKDVILTS